MVASMLSDPEVRSGLRQANAFWRALGRGDGDALAMMLDAAALESVGPGPGLAERLRDRLGIAPESCFCLGVVSPVLLADERRIRTTYTFTSVPLPRGRVDADAAWCLEVAEVDGTWRIDPMGSHHLAESAHRWVSLGYTWAQITEAR